MTITLIVETGAGMPDSNTYVDEAFAIQYAEVCGLTLPADSEMRKSAIMNGMRYVESFFAQYQGFKTDPEQACQFPRNNCILYGYKLESDVIPAILKQAQVQAAVLDAGGTALFADTGGHAIKREKTDVLETEYFEGLDSGDGRIVFTAIESLLKPLFIFNSGYRLTARHGF